MREAKQKEKKNETRKRGKINKFFNVKHKVLTLCADMNTVYPPYICTYLSVEN